MNLREYFQRLGSDNAEYEKYKHNPRSAMTEAGVSSEDIDAVLSGDLARIRAAMGAGVEGLIIIIIAT